MLSLVSLSRDVSRHASSPDQAHHTPLTPARVTSPIPQAGDAADAEPSPKRGRRRSAASDGPWPPSSAALASQLEGLLSDLGRLAQARPLPSAPLLVLQRACLSALSAPGLPHLHVRSAAALAAVFLGSPDLRSAVMDDLISQARFCDCYVRLLAFHR